MKVTKTERDRADRLAKSAAGAALEADVQGETTSNTKTFVPGEGLSTEAVITTSFTAEEKEQIRQLVANASSPAEIEEIEQCVQRGVLPPQLQSLQRKRPPTAMTTTTTTENGTTNTTGNGEEQGQGQDVPPTKRTRVESTEEPSS